MLDFQKGAPALYLQIKKILRTDILNQLYPLGTYIPTETELEKIFGVSKITIRNAIQDLEDEGYLKKQKGRGTLVIQNHYFNKLSKTMSYSEKLVELGILLSKENISVVELTLHPNNPAYDLMEPDVLSISRTFLANNSLLSHIETYIPKSLDVALNIHEKDWSLYQDLSTHGIIINCFQDYFSAILADAHIAKKLELTIGTPILKRIRIGYNHNKKVIEYSIAYYLSETIPYIIEMGK
ncbi:GntR family transcriptional regulator [Erysipelotrichaceae bacterium]|nr:GntR family transcriptional regulator [Erysipelotrichaceae bacterium]